MATSSPWIFRLNGKVSTLSDGRSHRMSSVPDGTICVSSSDDWLLLGFFHIRNKFYFIDSYILHNEFSNTSIPLPELDFIIRADKNIRMFRIRSTADDFVIAAITTSLPHPLVVIKPGKGVWLPEPPAEPYIYINDIAFLGDTLYSITIAEDLVPLHLTSDVDGRPLVTMGRRVIKQPPDYHGYVWWPASDDDDDEDEQSAEQKEEDFGVGDDDDVSEQEGEATGVYNDDDYVAQEEEATGIDDATEEEVARVDTEQEEEAAGVTNDDDDDAEQEDDAAVIDDNDDDDAEQKEEGAAALSDDDDDDDELPVAASDFNCFNCSDESISDDEITYWHLVESSGKLLMVKTHMHILPTDYSVLSLCPVDVFEADMDMHACVPMVNGLGGGRALFMGLNFSKSVSAPLGEVEEDVVYLIQSGEVFNMKTRTCSPQRFCDPTRWGQCGNLLFPPELVL
ncbi:hypothetical protein ACQ4PT_026285 [Festuca glaucescens]